MQSSLTSYFSRAPELPSQRELSSPALFGSPDQASVLHVEVAPCSPPRSNHFILDEAECSGSGHSEGPELIDGFPPISDFLDDAPVVQGPPPPPPKSPPPKQPGRKRGGKNAANGRNKDLEPAKKKVICSRCGASDMLTLYICGSRCACRLCI
jgi:hypothetical protein